MKGRNEMTVAVIGAGKMGLPLACQFASRGASVVACDRDPRIVESINSGTPPFVEPGLADLLVAARTAGKLKAVLSIEECAGAADTIVVITPVLLSEERRADLTGIEEIALRIGRVLTAGTLVSFETTVPVGATRDRLRPRLETGGLRAGAQFDLVFSPERVKSQHVLEHLTKIPKIVGGLTPHAASRAVEFYSRYLGCPGIDVGSLEAAEFAKLAGMVYRDVNIALANELAMYAEAAGLDFKAVRDAINTDGEASILAPGIGVGGHCTPIYPHFLLSDAADRAVDLRLTASARSINHRQPARLLNRLEQDIGTLRSRTLLILGLGFRPQVKEHICSPAFDIQAEAVRRGAAVSLCDPLYSDQEIRQHGFTPGDLSASRLPEVIILNTAHEEYRRPDFASLRRRGVTHIIDGRNFWDRRQIHEAGLILLAPGLNPLANQVATAV